MVYLVKKRDGVGNIFERLDRGRASTSWISMFPQANIVHHVFTSSDHCQISLNYLSKATSKTPPFRFEKMRCLRKDYDSLVKKTWCTHFDGSHMFRLTKKM